MPNTKDGLAKRGLPKYDPLSDEVMENPFPTYAAMREAFPVQYYDGLSVPYYILLRHQDVADAEVDTTRYSAAQGASAMYYKTGALRQDGAGHMAFRNLFIQRFSPQGLARYREVISAIVDELIDDFLAKGPPAEFYRQFCLPLPVRMTCVLLGLPEAQWEYAAEIGDRLMMFNWTVQLTPERERTIAEVRGFLDQYIDQRRALLKAAGIDEPGPEHVGSVVPDDIISDIICGKVEGRRVNSEETYELLQALLVGGIETTAHLLTNSIWRLLEDRSRWEQVAADPERLIPVAIEESLRFDPPGLGLWRTTVREFELHGRAIPANAKVQMSYGSANRDPRVFSDPDTFRLDRAPAERRKHITFGAGPHTCIGQHLARLEANIALARLFERTPNLRLAGKTERVHNFGFWGRGKLPIAWS